MTMPAGNATVSVKYQSICYALTLGHTGSGGKPTANPGQSTGCAAGQYILGETITLTASPDSGFQVGSWTGTDHDAARL